MFVVKMLVAKMFPTRLPRTQQVDAPGAVEVVGSKASEGGEHWRRWKHKKKDNLMIRDNFQPYVLVC